MTLSANTKDILKGSMIISLMISTLCCVFLLQGCTTKQSRLKQLCQGSESLIFYNITDGKDTCLVCSFCDFPYEELNIKVLDRESFDLCFFKKILNDEVIEVSEAYYQEQKPYHVVPVDAISALYDNYGLDGLLSYLNKYPIHQLSKDNPAAFDWAAYLLWKNGIDVALGDEVYQWYIIDQTKD